MSLKPQLLAQDHSNDASLGACVPVLPASAAHERDAGCRRAIDAFVAQRMTAEEFHCGFRQATGGDVADPRLVGQLRTIRNLCDAYAVGLPPGAGYRVSEEQFRSEVCHLAAHAG